MKILDMSTEMVDFTGFHWKTLLDLDEINEYL